MIDTMRHDEVFNARKNNQKIAIIGAGAIGSRVFASLVELGLTNITVHDFDTVASHNLANQIFNYCHIDVFKVIALADWFMKKTGDSSLPKEIKLIPEKVTKETPIAGNVFLLVDSMAAREQIFKENIFQNTSVYNVIDVRMASTHGNIFTFNPHTQGNQWLSTLTDDALAETSACGSSLTVGTTASILSNLAVWQFMHLKTNKEAVDDIINIYLKPLCVATQTWSKG